MKMLSFFVLLSTLLGLAAIALGVDLLVGSSGIPDAALPPVRPVLLGEVELVDEEHRFLELKVARSNAVFPEEGAPLLSDKNFLRQRISFGSGVAVIEARFDIRDGIIEEYRQGATSTAMLSLGVLQPGTVVRVVGKRDEEGVYQAEFITIVRVRSSERTGL